jgi:hypothetical protein
MVIAGLSFNGFNTEEFHEFYLAIGTQMVQAFAQDPTMVEEWEEEIQEKVRE